VSKLVLHIPGGGMRDIPLHSGRITLGRRADNDVWLPYPAVSADHAAIVTVLDDSFLEDLQSTNGTLVNGNRITKHFLRDHDVIDLGRVHLVYFIDNDEVAAALEAGPAALQASAVRDEPTALNVSTDSMEAGAKSTTLDERELAPVDHLLAELMETTTDEAVAVEIPPALSVVEESRIEPSDKPEARAYATAGVYVEVMNGPNAGQIAPMTKREFVLGQRGATKAAIRRDDDRFILVRIDLAATIAVNDVLVTKDSAPLAFGDTIDVGGVLLRFGRRPPL
jgi:predicted component of type VI protein secretion system